MQIDVRPFAGSLRDWFDAVVIAFGERVTEDDLPVLEGYVELDRAIGAYDGARTVGTAGIFSFAMTIPGGSVPAAGVTMVGVHPTHRRRGILTALMRAQLDAIHDRGEPVAILWASEPQIYGRFGYGLASFKAAIEIERSHASFIDPLPSNGTFRLLEPDEATAACRPVYERFIPMRAGAVSRNEGWWRAEFVHDPERWRRGGGPAFFVLHETDGSADAYARYRIHGDWDARGARGMLEVSESIAITPDADRALWSYLLSADLTSATRARNIPVDSALRHMLAEPRRLGMTVGDALWLRIVDLPAALAARRYAARDRLVLEVRDAFCGWNAGRWEVEAMPDGAEAHRTTSDPDLTLGAAELGATYLGGISMAELAIANRIEENTPGAVMRADALLRTPLAPWCPADF